MAVVTPLKAIPRHANHDGVNTARFRSVCLPAMPLTAPHRAAGRWSAISCTAVAVQEIVSDGLPPFLLTYICTVLFVLFLPLHWLSAAWSRRPDAAHSVRMSALRQLVIQRRM